VLHNEFTPSSKSKTNEEYEMKDELAFSIKAACNIIFESGYSYQEVEQEIFKLRDNGKIQDGYILGKDLPKIKSIN
jgi:hypothetical protein